MLTFKNGTVCVGDIFVSSWGYEQTNVNFEIAYKTLPEEEHEFTSYS